MKIKSTLTIYLAVVLTVSHPIPLTQAEETIPPANPAFVSATPVVPETPGVAPAAVNAQEISLNFQNTDLDLVLKFFSQATGQIFLKSDTVHGFVTVMAPTKVPMSEALKILQAVLNLKGFMMVSGPGNMVRVLTQAEAAQANTNLTSGNNEDSITQNDNDQMVTHIVPIKFAATQDLKQQLGSLLSKDGSIVTDERTNSLLITDTGTNVRRLLRTIAKLDIRTPEVLIEAMIMEISLSDEFKLGVEWGYTGTTHNDKHEFGTDTTQKFSLADNIAEGIRYAILRDDARFSATLQALSTNKDVNVVATPHVMTLNNQTATIRVGEEVPVLTQTRNVQGGDTIRSFDYKSVAVELEVTPRINSDRDVLMKVHPLVKNILGYNAELNAPILGTREAQTAVLVKDGQTIVIGGLIANNHSTSDSKVPLLGELPLIGSLFKRTDKTNDKTELIVFLTPHVVTTTDEAQTVTTTKEAEIRQPNTPNRLEARKHWELGVLYYKKKQYQDAIGEWDQTIQLSPDKKLRDKAQRYKDKTLRKLH